ncbi:MAG: hypothetical protein H8Z69_02115 [Nanohaloarchaea archaeon]|nr:hypothetical protein [Candidatus Nanohaloarchaea archaeon]
MLWQEVRDWRFEREISELGESSFDLITRDVWLANGSKADILKYDHDAYKVEAGWFYDKSAEVDRSEVVDVLRSTGVLLSEEVFNPRLYISNADNARIGDYDELSEDYFFSSDTPDNEVFSGIEPVLASSFDELEQVESKEY